jgi:toxin-antitoxin system PIN domain toxin
VKIIDLNLVIYAHNENAPMHRTAGQWWEQALNQTETIGLSWVVMLGFLRIMTNRRIMPSPLQPEQAIEIVNTWTDQDVTQIVLPGKEHWSILKSLLHDAGVAANITTDAHLAAIAIENGATLYSADNDFARFKNLNWKNPLI